MTRNLIPKPDIRAISLSGWGYRPEMPIHFCVGRQGDGRCTAEVTESLGSIHLCNGHFEEILGALRGRDETPGNFRFVPRAVTYYLGNKTTRHIKIGTTTRLRQRFMTLTSASHESVLLATEPGSFDVERARHRQFRSLRVRGEHFRAEPVLLDHIAAMRKEHGILETGDGKLPAWAVAPLKS